MRARTGFVVAVMALVIPTAACRNGNELDGVGAPREAPTTTSSTTTVAPTTTSTTTSTVAPTTAAPVTTTAPPTTAKPKPALPATTAAPPPATAAPAGPRPAPGIPGSLGSCSLFPRSNYWYADVSTLPVHALSANYVNSVGAGKKMHADFGSGAWDGGPIGIPFTLVPAGQPGANIAFEYGDESEPGPYPIPADAPIEGGPNSDGDRHILVVEDTTCRLYEVFAAYPDGGGGWNAGSGAVWDLSSNALRPDGWTSADAAGLPILPGLVRYDEVAAGRIDHAIRITVPKTQKAYVWPARHRASSSTDPNLPPMGTWFRLRADFDISGFPAEAQVILQALKTHGGIVADNGSAWYISGAPDERWDNDALHTLGQVPGSAFEAVDASSMMVDPNSGEAR
jgi:hypothetical protein